MMKRAGAAPVSQKRGAGAAPCKASRPLAVRAVAQAASPLPGSGIPVPDDVKKFQARAVSTQVTQVAEPALATTTEKGYTPRTKVSRAGRGVRARACSPAGISASPSQRSLLCMPVDAAC